MLELPWRVAVGMPESNLAAIKTLTEHDAATPEDVATLYSWANLHGAKYRDFSASRAQARDETRLRAERALAEEKRREEEEAERRRQEEVQLAARLAAEAAEAARRAEAERLAEIARQAEAERQAVLAAQEAQRRAPVPRVWQPPLPEIRESISGPSHAASDPLPPFVESPVRSAPSAVTLASGNRDFALPQFPARFRKPAASPALPPATQRTQNSGSQHASESSPVEPTQFTQPASVASSQLSSAFRSSALAPPEYPAAQFAMSQYPSESPAVPHYDPFLSSPWNSDEPRELPETRELPVRPAWLAAEPPIPSIPRPQFHQPTPTSQYAPAFPQPAQAQIPAYPAFSGQNPVRSFGQDPGPYLAHGSIQSPSQNPAQVEDTLQGSRDRIANRWYALKSVFDPQAVPVEQAPVQPPARVPALAVFSLAGGVGKTSLIASLGRALSSRGERVLLVDTAPFGLLPFFFGARDQRPGALRTFNPPGVSSDAPVQLLTLDPEGPPPSEFIDRSSATASEDDPQTANQDWLAQEIGRYARSANRVLIDLPSASGATTRRILRLSPTVLVPVLPDMNSVVSVNAIESFFRSNSGPDTSGKKIMPYYLLNQFDYSLPLHLDVREILREQIGDRLLPFALRRSPAVSEALAEGMTVMDYAPNVVVAEDYTNLAGWVRSLSAPATQSYRGVRWSER